MMQIFRQTDIRWAGDKLGNSGLTMGRYGCTTTCISMLSSYFGRTIYPGEMVKLLKYTKEGLVIWGSADFDAFRFQERFYGWNNAKIDTALKDPDLAVILEVANKSHWVVATKRIPLSQHYVIADPATGTRSISAKYGNITGGAIFKRK